MSCRIEVLSWCARQTFLSQEHRRCTHLILVLFRVSSQVISAAQLKSEEFERALSQQHTAMAGDEKGSLALKLLALLSGGDDEVETAQAGKELQKMWTQAHASSG